MPPAAKRGIFGVFHPIVIAAVACRVPSPARAQLRVLLAKQLHGGLLQGIAFRTTGGLIDFFQALARRQCQGVELVAARAAPRWDLTTARPPAPARVAGRIWTTPKPRTAVQQLPSHSVGRIVQSFNSRELKDRFLAQSRKPGPGHYRPVMRVRYGAADSCMRSGSAIGADSKRRRR
jgi:hypothetical protein